MLRSVLPTLARASALRTRLFSAAAAELPKKMRCLMKREAKVGLWLEEAPLPKYNADEVLIKIKQTAICGTDHHIYHWNQWSQQVVGPHVPMIIGHEFVGEIVRVGDAVKSLKVGERVSGEGHVVCGTCRNCRAGHGHNCRNVRGVGVTRQGCFADYLSIPACNVVKLPPAVTDDLACCMDPLGNAIHTTLSFDLYGEDVLITGAGPIGCFAAAIARHCGARYIVVTDVQDYRLNLAKSCGANVALNVRGKDSTALVRETMTNLGMKEGFDVGLEMSGNVDAYKAMLATMNNGGHIGLLGLFPGDVTVNLNAAILKGLKWKGVYGREMFETWYKMTALLEGGLTPSVSKVVTHRMPVADFEKGIAAMDSGNCGKVVLTW